MVTKEASAYSELGSIEELDTDYTRNHLNSGHTHNYENIENHPEISPFDFHMNQHDQGDTMSIRSLDSNNSAYSEHQ